MNVAVQQQLPVKWPFPPSPPARRPGGRRADPHATLRDAQGTPAEPGQGVGLKAMVVDVLMVAAWGALIPGLMWLGAAAGF